MGRLNV